MLRKKHVYVKSDRLTSDFIYVDLLPEVRRARQFNVNVVITLLYAIVLAFFLIYSPYRDGTFTLEDTVRQNNDLQHELSLVQEEFDGYEIDLAAIQFEEDITMFQARRIDFNNLMDDVELIVDDHHGRIRNVQYDASTSMLSFEVLMVSQFGYNSINNDLLILPWVENSTFDVITKSSDVEYLTTFEIEVNYDAK
jgi:hypothetical protein